MSYRFKTEPGTVLYGLKSYWEGFDAPGETLSYLFIEKPPYPHPGDPLVAARQRAIAERGGDPFLDYVLPMTAIQFTQGFGRLIRSETDKGAAWCAIEGCTRRPRLNACSSAHCQNPLSMKPQTATMRGRRPSNS